MILGVLGVAMRVAVGTPVARRPPQIRACGILPYGSYFGCFAKKRWFG